MGQKEQHKKNKRQFEENEHTDTIYQNVWNAAKVILKEKCIALNAYVKKKKKKKILK